ncbi:hypothetical protein RB4448 [Rhodopirellula baltica SH 1]|uniref:Uncharacterized protein n=1 Tax=Rhodopirellula baltica (strain DSM 10527 / NCIMB 13988 / SH1) TaxID=243090 RepID=Q7USK6_RHOBA|nr:hypothetical protein RB4448 [Rhodopirellula baltica SH 1]
MDGTSPLMLEHRVLVQSNREFATRRAFAVYSAERSHWMVAPLLPRVSVNCKTLFSLSATGDSITWISPSFGVTKTDAQTGSSPFVNSFQNASGGGSGA